MIVVLLILCALLPLAITPGLLFHYDVSPKVILLLLAACAALLRTKALPCELAALWGRRNGRILILLSAAQAVWVTAVTIGSTRPWFSLFGSGWREFGLVTTLALITVTVLTTAHFCAHPERIRFFLKTAAVAAIAGSLYGIAQYFDVDPLQPSSIYRAMAGDSVIIRPPGTFGHADYFGWWLAVAFFCGIALSRTRNFVWSKIGIWCATLAGAATLLSGTRSALLAIVAGASILAFLSRPTIRPRHLLVAGVLAVLAGGFYFSSAGTRLRARAVWSAEEPAGGARPLLWRDSLRMAADRPLLGYGPETFQASFGRWQSADLARLYPDFHHESPHNVALDALASAGVPGLILLFAWGWLAWRAVAAARRTQSPWASSLAAGLAASTAGAMFSAFSLSPVLLTLMILAALLALESSDVPAKLTARRWTTGFCYAGAACFACLAGARAVSDFKFAKFQQNPTLAGYNSAVASRLPGAGEDLYCSRVLLNACGSLSGIPARLECWRAAEQVAARAITSADDTANAWYNLAYFTAAQNDARGTAMALGGAIQIYPNWFKPHWALAKLLAQSGDQAQASSEARRADFLNANHDPEVAQTARDLGTITH